MKERWKGGRKKDRGRDIVRGLEGREGREREREREIGEERGRYKERKGERRRTRDRT